MRETSLKMDPDGYYRRNLGFICRDGKWSQPKISLGQNKRDAQERLERIAAIWRRIEHSCGEEGIKPYWDKTSLEIAKAIGKGRAEYRHQPTPAELDSYLHDVDAHHALYPEIKVKPSDEALYEEQKAVQTKTRANLAEHHQRFLSISDRFRSMALLVPTTDASASVNLVSDQMLHEALAAYSDHISTTNFDKSENAINDTGLKRQGLVKQLKSHLPDQPLRLLSDFSSVDKLFGILRNRPVTFRYKKPMARRTAVHLIAELKRFCGWLDTSAEWQWHEPANYRKIGRRPLTLESDANAKDVPTYSIDQLKMLFEFATPLERFLIVLAVNCSYGADQIGRLRIGETVKGKSGRCYIQRVRYKSKVVGVHRLFAVTVDAIRWATQGREDQKQAHVLVNGKNKPLWRKTKGGNRCHDIPNAWYRLLARIRRKHPTFPRHGFNTLRDTSANLIRKIAGGEVASIHLTHGHPSTDKLLRSYTNIPWKRVHKAQRILERKVADAFAFPTDPWQERSRKAK